MGVEVLGDFWFPVCTIEVTALATAWSMLRSVFVLGVQTPLATPFQSPFPSLVPGGSGT